MFINVQRTRESWKRLKQQMEPMWVCTMQCAVCKFEYDYVWQSPNICAKETKKHPNEVNAMCETTEQTVTKAGQGHQMISHLQRKNIQIIIDTLFSSGSYHFLTADIKDPIKVFRFNYQKRPHISHKEPYFFQFFNMDFLQIYIKDFCRGED